MGVENLRLITNEAHDLKNLEVEAQPARHLRLVPDLPPFDDEDTLPIPHTTEKINLLPGERCSEFVIKNCIAETDAANVYRATNPESENSDGDVALKVYHESSKLAKTIAVSDIRHHAVLQRMGIEGIVPTIDVGTMEDKSGVHRYLAMPYASEGHLSKLALRPNGTIFPEGPDSEKTKRILRCMADAAFTLAAMHKQGLVHCDFKPGNILVHNDEKQDVTWLTDFESVTESGVPLTHSHATERLTVGFVPTETIKYKIATPAMDNFALAVSLYRVLTNKLPFKGSDFEDSKRAQTYDIVTPPQYLNRDIPSEIGHLIVRGLGSQVERPEALEYGEAFRRAVG